MLVVIFLSSVSVFSLLCHSLSSNKLFATIKWVCRKILNNDSETSLQRKRLGPKTSARYREVSSTERFFPNLLILLQKPTLGRQSIVQSTPKCVKRPLLGEEKAKKKYIWGYHVHMIIQRRLVVECLQRMKEPTNEVDKNVVAVVCTKFLL